MLTITSRITISAPKETVSRYLRELKNIPDYEPRIETAEVVSSSGEQSEVSAAGRFLGLAWKGNMKVTFTRDGGYQAESPLGSIARLEAAYRIHSVSGGTVLTHEEKFHFPFLIRPFMFVLQGAFLRAAEDELGFIKEGAELLARRLQLRDIEKQV